MSQSIKIYNKSMGLLLEETFADSIQFKIFLQTVNGCLTSKSDLDFFNGMNFLLHVPYEILKESVITTKVEAQTLTEKLMNKSLLEG